MNPIDDYDLIDLDYEEFIRRGLEELQWEHEHQEHSSHTRDAKTHN